MTDDASSQIPRIETRCLRRGGTLSLTTTNDTGLVVIYGEGGGCVLEFTGGVAGLWIPLRGSLQTHCGGLIRPIFTGEVLVTEHDPCVKAIGHARGQWLAMLGSKRAWKWFLNEVSAADNRLLPEVYKADRDLRRRAISVARAASPMGLEGTLLAVADSVAALQTSLHGVIARCPGRTRAKRLQVFLRLQRVRNYIRACCNRNLDNEALALMAHFSPCYFLRTFKAAYLETPHSYLSNERLQRAERLLHSSDLAIAEVALASGFENRCVFSRTYRKRFGMTAQESRRHKNAMVVA